MEAHFNKATEEVTKMEKCFNSAIDHLTKAINEKEKEYTSIKDENAMLRQRQQYMNEFITVMVAFCILLYLLGFTSGWYVCP